MRMRYFTAFSLGAKSSHPRCRNRPSRLRHRDRNGVDEDPPEGRPPMLTMEIEMDDSTMQKAARTARPGALERTTGRDRQGWFAVLDTWGAAGRPYREIADWLTSEHGLTDWWAQKLIVEYEEARGIRPAGVRRDGTFEVGASKMVAADIDRVRE